MYIVVPANDNGKIFTSFYVVISIIIVGVLFDLWNFFSEVYDGDEEFEISHGVRDLNVKSPDLIVENYKGLIAFGALLLFYVVGILFFMFLENMSFVDAFYVSTMTLSTVGYGDLYPQSETYKLLFTFWIGFGIIIFGLCVNIVLGSSLKKRKMRWMLRVREKRRKRLEEMTQNATSFRGLLSKQKEVKNFNHGKISEAEFILFHLEKNGEVSARRILVSNSDFVFYLTIWEHFIIDFILSPHYSFQHINCLKHS